MSNREQRNEYSIQCRIGNVEFEYGQVRKTPRKVSLLRCVASGVLYGATSGMGAFLLTNTDRFWSGGYFTLSPVSGVVSAMESMTMTESIVFGASVVGRALLGFRTGPFLEMTSTLGGIVAMSAVSNVADFVFFEKDNPITIKRDDHRDDEEDRRDDQRDDEEDRKEE